jgi:hypothetical protein
LGFPSIPVDAQDAVAVYRVATESIALMRQGRGPTLIECLHYLKDGPIESMENYLARKGIFRPGYRRQVETGFGVELDAVIAEILPSCSQTG